jgi:hypothetical protein
MIRFRSIAVFVAVLFCSGLFSAVGSFAGVEVNIHLPLPKLFLPMPPPLVVVPGTYVYAAPDADADIAFYQGAWYRPHDGVWYIANGYNGPWRAMSPERVPRVLAGLPPNFRRVPPGHERMPYGHVQKNWKTWEHEQHWDDRGNKKGKHGNGGEHDHGHGKDHEGHGRGHEGHGEKHHGDRD